MTDTDTAPLPQPHLLARAIGVVVSPTKTFEGIVAAPKVAGAILLVTLMSVMLFGGFLSTERGRNAFFDQAYDRIQQSNNTAEQQAQAQAAMEKFQALATDKPALFVFFLSATSLVGVPLATLVFGGVFFVVFNVVMGGTASFKQVIAVVAHAQFVLTLGQLITIPLNFIRGSMTSATNFSVLFPMVEETSFVGRLLGSLDLFVIWGTIVLALGLGVLYRRNSRVVAGSLLGVYVAIALLIAFIRSR